MTRTPPILRLTTEAGDSCDDPSEDALFEYMGDLGPSNTWLVVERLEGPQAGDRARLTLTDDAEHFDVELHDGSTSRGVRFEDAHELLTRWSFELPDRSSSDDEPAMLSIGAILGDSDAENMAWKRAINALTKQAQARRADVSSPLGVNVVYHVNGRLVPNEFEGVRTGWFDKERRHLVVQAAVPDEPTDDRSAVLLTLLHASIDEAERFARSKGLADSLPELRALVEHLG